MKNNLSDEQIIQGFREGNHDIVSKYFYGYCQVGYNIFDQKYQLRNKENLDFLSLSHQYAIYLMERDWKPLEDHSPEVSLRTWFINGFRYVVLDALKWYRKEFGNISFEDYLTNFNISGDIRLQFNKIVQDLCESQNLSGQDRTIIDMILIKGFKGKEVAEQLEMTPAAISQKYKALKEKLIIPYFKKHFDMELETPEILDVREEMVPEFDYMPSAECNFDFDISFDKKERRIFHDIPFPRVSEEEKKYTPENITHLLPNQIFVFGSNLKGIHRVGLAYIAFVNFGAIMGQGIGLQGQSYAIPSMQGGVDKIRPYVEDFIVFAATHPSLTFFVTRIGCGLAGFSDQDIAPLFRAARSIKNIYLPHGW